MTTLTVNIKNKKTEKAIKAVLDAFDLDYDITQGADEANNQPKKSGYTKKARLNFRLQVIS